MTWLAMAVVVLLLRLAKRRVEGNLPPRPPTDGAAADAPAADERSSD